MNNTPPDSLIAPTSLEGEPFVIHSINGYTNVLIEVIAETQDLSDNEVHKLLHTMHQQVISTLSAKGVNYNDFSTALTPRSDKHEIAFVFDSLQSTSLHYGGEFSEVWLSALRLSGGPTRTAILEGDVIGLQPELVWKILDEQLVRPLGQKTPQLSSEQYFVVYFTNISDSHLSKLDHTMRLLSPAYLGYINCSGSVLFKTGLPLAQVALRIDNKIITTEDEDGNANPHGYAFNKFGFNVIGVNEDLYGTLLDFKIDMGIPDWNESDGAIALGALSGIMRNIAGMTLTIDDTRFEYLKSEEPGYGHGVSIRKAGLGNLSKDRLAEAIKNELSKSLLYNLRSVAGSKLIDNERIAAPENNALLFSVQVEFPDNNGLKQRYQVGIKYQADKHRGEVTTMFG
ncbi:MAG TPA: hypothetical protein VN081_01715 [Dongiaceae bacterium]|nr:hypothetical protein [Dongiaceae bacterium]